MWIHSSSTLAWIASILFTLLSYIFLIQLAICLYVLLYMVFSVILYLHLIFFAFAPVVDSLFVVALRIRKHKVLLLLFSPFIKNCDVSTDLRVKVDEEVIVGLRGGGGGRGWRVRRRLRLPDWHRNAERAAIIPVWRHSKNPCTTQRRTACRRAATRSRLLLWLI